MARNNLLPRRGAPPGSILDALAAREPAIAVQIRACLFELAELNAEDFLGMAAASLLIPGSPEGKCFGAYTLERTLGDGGMGTVWLAHRSDGRFEGQAAVKLLNVALAGHPSEQRLAREGSVLATLQHPNIAHLLDASVTPEGQPYLVLEYVRGEHIDQYCEEHRLGIEQRIALFLDVLAAVAHAHRNLIVHRDIKPSNILVTEDGVVKLLDFGVAALLSPESESSTHAAYSPLAGLTPGYAAPEQVRREAVTTATDVYALGLVLFVLLVGQHPSSPEGKTREELMQQTLDSEAPRASEMARDIGRRRVLRGDLDYIIAMALRRNPAERYTTVDLFAQDLRGYLAREPVSARPRSLRYLAGRFVRRHVRAVAAVTAIAIALVGAVVVTSYEMFEAREQRDHARLQSRRAEASKDFLARLVLSGLRADGVGPTFHDRIAFGLEMLDKQYRDDPQFAARMLVEIGNGYRDNQETHRADELFQRAYEIGRTHNDAELMAVAQCSRAYADGYADVAEGVLKRIVEARQLLAQTRNPDVQLQASCLMAESVVERKLGHNTTAEAFLQRAIGILEKDGSTGRRIYLEAFAQLGEIYLARNQPRELLRISQWVGERMERAGLGRTAGRLVARQNAATALNALGETRLALAEREIINRRVPEVESPGQEPLLYAINYAVVLVRMGRPALALRALEGVPEQARNTGNRFVLTQALLAAGSALADSGHWVEGEAALKETVSLASGGIGNMNAAAQAESFMARMDLARGNLESARGHRDRALALAGYRTQKPERSLPKVLLMAAKIALAEGAASEAERFAGDALAICEPIARGPNTSADVGEALLRLAQARLSSGSGDTAKRMLERAVESLTNGLGADHPLAVEARSVLARTSVSKITG